MKSKVYIKTSLISDLMACPNNDSPSNDRQMTKNHRRPVRHGSIIFGVAAALFIVGFLTACVRPPPSLPETLVLQHVTFEELPGWEDDRHAAIVPAFLKSCQKIIKRSPEQDFGAKTEMGKIHDWITLCRDADRLSPDDDGEARRFWEDRFIPYAVGFGNEKDIQWEGLFTGYYEPELQGSLGPDARFTYPIFAKPDDLITVDLGRFRKKLRNQRIAGRVHKGRLVPYYDRAEIETGALDGRGLELLWVDAPVDAFFLHIQGSGRVRLPDGSYIRLGYAGTNGRPYTTIGRELVASGEMTLEEVSMPAIRRWIADNPAAGVALMRKNQSYIFFRIGESDGPIGAQGVVLTPRRSLAVDTNHFSLGMPLWLVTTDPGTEPSQPLRRLVVAQDTGGAIRGAVRGDLFWGYGDQAADKAGIMKEQGRYYILLPRAARPS